MKTASSIRYGGMLVDSDECDYDSFKNLGLLCPICQRTVFLVKGATRSTTERKLKDGSTTKVKECNIESYFAHHPEVDKNIINDCELRSNQITATERLYLETKSRNQRQKIMQSHFYKILKTSYSLRSIELTQVKDIFRQHWLSQCVYAEKRALFALQELVNMIVTQLRLLEKGCIIEYANKEIEIVGTKGYGDPTNECFEYFAEWSSVLNLKMQSSIVAESFSFIQHKKQIRILENLIYYGINAVLHQRYVNDCKKFSLEFNQDSYSKSYARGVRELIGFSDIKDMNNLIVSVRTVLIGTFCQVRWAYQFELLEQQAVERKK